MVAKVVGVEFLLRLGFLNERSAEAVRWVKRVEMDVSRGAPPPPHFDKIKDLMSLAETGGMYIHFVTSRYQKEFEQWLDSHGL